jgi:urease accessory protein UreH
MNRNGEIPTLNQKEDGLEMEPELREAIGNFKSSIDAWSDSAISRPRQVSAPARIGWDLATVSGGVYQNYRQQESAKIETARMAQQQRELAAQRATEEADLMARVDNDIAREVPSALEPLASLMDENQGTGN